MATSLAILKKYGVKPRKKLGQSFLIDDNIATGIVNSSDIGRDDIVVEIGPGHGVLTSKIVEKARKIIAVEIDRQMVDILREELKNASNLEIIHQDILDYDFAAPLKENSHTAKVKIIGNVPYGISSQILFRLIEFRDNISSVVCMFQKEVAERITAVPSTKEYGILSILAAMHTIPSTVMHVPASCFYPRPRVDSSVLKMDIRETPLYEVRDSDIFLKVVKCAFAKRRKTLFNNLRGSDLFPSGTQDVQKILDRLCIDGHRRGETLTVKEFGMLSNAILEL
mgnify:CR=1 FL=1